MKIIQITDMHLFCETGKTLFDYNTYNGLQAVVDYVHRHERAVDAVLLTGDISQDETEASYVLALEQVKRLGVPVYWVQGNHDDRACMSSVFAREPRVYPADQLFVSGWKCIVVDTIVTGEDGGYLTNEERCRVESLLTQAREQQLSVVLIMHHHPVAVGTPLLDDCMLGNGNELLQVVDQYPEVRAMICGHAHNDYLLRHKHCHIDVAPATCFQWKKGTSTLSTEDKRGYRRIVLGSDYSNDVVYI